GTPTLSICSWLGARWCRSGSVSTLLSASSHGAAGPDTAPAVRVPTSGPTPRSFTAPLKCSQADAHLRLVRVTSFRFSNATLSSVRLSAHAPLTSHRYAVVLPWTNAASR